MSLAALLLAMAQAVPLVPVELGEIRMHLFYEHSGQLSDDISPPRDFAAWNTVTGGGEAGQPANDLLIVAELRTEGQQSIQSPVRITASNERGRVLADRRFPDLFTSEAGRAYAPLWLPDAGCAGRIDVTVKFRNQIRTETLTLNCGE